MFCCCTAGLMTLSGCSTDDNIDVGDVDTTIGIGINEFDVPAGSADIPLEDVLDLGDEDVIQTLTRDSAGYKKGDYQFKKADDNITAADITIDEVKFNPETQKPMDEAFNVTFGYWMYVLQLISEQAGQAAELSFPFEFDFEAWIKAEAIQVLQGKHENPLQEKYYKKLPPIHVTTLNASGEGNENIVSLSKVNVDGTATIAINFNDMETRIELTEIDLILPKFLNVEIRPSEVKGLGQKGEAYYLKGEEHDTLRLSKISTKNNVEVPIRIKSLDNFSASIPSNPQPEDSYLFFGDKLELQAAISMQMRVGMGKDNFNAENLSTPEATESRDINAFIRLSDEIVITHAEGHFKPKVDIDPSLVELNDIPDFLTGDDAKIMLDNPTIVLPIKNDIDVEAFLTGKFTALDENDQPIRRLYIEGDDKNHLTLFAHPFEKYAADKNSTTNTLIIISRNGVDLANAEALKKQYGVETGHLQDIKRHQGGNASHPEDPIATGDISELLNPIPKKLEFSFDVKVNSDKVAKIDLYDGNDQGVYKIQPSYEFVAPLALQKDAQIVYRDTVNDWNGDIKDNNIEMKDGDEITVTADVYNGTPLTLALHPKAIKIGGEELQGVTVSNVELPSNWGETPQFNVKDDLKPGTSKLVIKLRFERGRALQELDGLAFNVVAKSVSPVTLNKETQKILIRNMQLNIKGHPSIKL